MQKYNINRFDFYFQGKNPVHFFFFENEEEILNNFESVDIEHFIYQRMLTAKMKIFFSFSYTDRLKLNDLKFYCLFHSKIQKSRHKSNVHSLNI